MCIFFAAPTVLEAAAIRELLTIFERSAGLSINLAKCSLTLIYSDQDGIEQMSELLQCQILPFPIKYLGLPLSTRPIPKCHLRPLVDKVAAKLPPWKGTLMDRSGRLVLIKSTMMATPIYALMAEQIPAWVREGINAICRKFLWSGRDQDVRGKCMVNWPTVCLPMQLGGLRIVDLKLTGIALQCRWLWLQKTDANRAWAELPIRAAPEVRALFQASISVVLGDGRSAKFWTDNWLEGQSVVSWAPSLAQAVCRRARAASTVERGLTEDHWIRDITGILSVEAIREFLLLWNKLRTIVLRQGHPDHFLWRWTSSGQFTAHSAYQMLLKGRIRFHGADLIWKAWSPLRVKIFLWLACRNRHWTADRRQRHGLASHALCALCDQEPETCIHLLIQCSFARQVWCLIARKLGMALLPHGDDSLIDWWLRMRDQLQASQRKGFDSLFALTTWHIWKERNARIFRDDSCDLQSFLSKLQHDGELWIQAGAKKLGSLFCE